jgi:septum site-determining protein MinC
MAVSSYSEQIQVRAKGGEIHLHLPTEPMPWEDLFQELRLQMQMRRSFWGVASPLTLWCPKQELETHHIQAIASLLQTYHLKLHRVYTQHRSTAVAAARLGYSVTQDPFLTSSPPVQQNEAPLYIQTTLRSGARVHHSGSVMLMGDVNPGAEVIAWGDILVWGKLRGMAHAGSQGDTGALIMALQLQPTQLRIANQVARPPEGSPPYPVPEVAYLQEGHVYIATAQDFHTIYKSTRQKDGV